MVAVTILLSKYAILYGNVVVTIQSVARRWTAVVSTVIMREGEHRYIPNYINTQSLGYCLSEFLYENAGFGFVGDVGMRYDFVFTPVVWQKQGDFEHQTPTTKGNPNHVLL